MHTIANITEESRQLDNMLWLTFHSFLFLLSHQFECPCSLTFKKTLRVPQDWQHAQETTVRWRLDLFLLALSGHLSKCTIRSTMEFKIWKNAPCIFPLVGTREMCSLGQFLLGESGSFCVNPVSVYVKKTFEQFEQNKYEYASKKSSYFDCIYTHRLHVIST